MNVLEKQAKRFVFFDLEKSALENVGTYAKQVGLSASVEMHHADSSRGTIELLPSLPSSSFIHIDPYEIDKKGDSGVTYLDILIQATQLGMKCLLWYGFMTEDDKESLDNYIVSSLEKAGIKDMYGVKCKKTVSACLRKESARNRWTIAMLLPLLCLVLTLRNWNFSFPIISPMKYWRDVACLQEVCMERGR